MKKLGSGAHMVELGGAESVLALNRRTDAIHYALFSCSQHRQELIFRGRTRELDDGLALRHVLTDLRERRAPAPTAVGHRLLYGAVGDARAQAQVDDACFAALAARVSLAPLQFGVELSLLQTARMALPSLPHIACFDTAFHATIPEVAFTYALPDELRDLGVRRLGFHGLSYEYVVDVLSAESLGRALLLNLGDTASIAAVRGGACIDTTMGLTPLGGLVMGTHPGDLDPGLILYLLRSGLDARALERMLGERAGIAGLSGESDVSMLVPRRGRDPAAALAFDLFVRSAQKWAGALVTVLGGLDSIVFLGEASANPIVRDEICAGLAHLGVVIEPARNRTKLPLTGRGSLISADRSRVLVRVMAADEELMIARHTRAALTHASKVGRAKHA